MKKFELDGSLKLSVSIYNEKLRVAIQQEIIATGLHEASSSAVEHYSKLEIKDLSVLMCVAFNQPQYKVDNDLNVIEVAGSPANTEIETKI